MKTIKAKVHRLPTEDVSCLWELESGSLICEDAPVKTKTTKTRNNHHLYITTDEEIKEGDWYLNLFNGKYRVIKCNDETLYDGENRKIIATTDPKLVYQRPHIIDEFGNHSEKKVNISLPQIPQSFIEEYCKAGGIDEVLVECNEIEVYMNTGIVREPVISGWIDKPKLNPDNTIIIHPVEEKMYNLTYKQLWSLFTHAQSWGYEHAMKDHVWQWKENEKGNQSIPKELNKWIEENL